MAGKTAKMSAKVPEKAAAKGADSPSQLIDARIKELGDWRGEMLARVRMPIKQADPDAAEPTACFRLPRRIHMTTMVISERRR